MLATVCGYKLGNCSEASVAQVVNRTTNCVYHPTDSPDALRSILDTGSVGLLIAYQRSPEEVDDLERLLEYVTAAAVPTVVLTECGSASYRLRLLQMGVSDVMVRPIDLSRLAFLVDVFTLRVRYQGASERQQTAIRCDGNAELLPEEQTILGPGGFFFTLSERRELQEQVQAVAQSNATVMISGETGTGKTHLARAIHAAGDRRESPFVSLGCGGLSPELLASELFGHRRGAFTGADRDYAGKFAEALNGTVLLDEVDCIPLASQSKLLRVVDDRVFEAVGSTKSETLHARLIATTNRSLEREMEAGRFRSDLFYRLNVVSFSLRPLRERRELIVPLARRFVADLNTSMAASKQIVPEALSVLAAYDWPGNMRELRNVVERCMVLCPGENIGPKDLPEIVRRARSAFQPAAVTPAETSVHTLDWARKEAELNELVEALRRNNNNRTNAALDLGVSRVTLYKKMHRYDLI